MERARNGKKSRRFPLLKRQSALCRLNMGEVTSIPADHLEHDLFPKAGSSHGARFITRASAQSVFLGVSESHVAGA